MWGHLRTAGTAAVIAVVLSTGASAIAGTGVGGVFNLGQTNTVNETTKLTGAKAGPMLDVTNTSTGSGATALRLAPTAGKPPLTSSSTVTATNLSADLVDGLEARFITRTAYSSSIPAEYFADTTETLRSVQLNAPVAGFVTLTAQATVDYNPCASFCSAALRFRDSVTGQTTPPVSLIGSTDEQSRGTLTSVVTVPASKALHTYELVGTSYGPAPIRFGNVAMSAQFTPFNGVGTSTPSSTSASAAAATSEQRAGGAPDQR